MNELDHFVQNLQEQISEKVKEDYGEVVFERWQNPLYRAVMEDPDASASLTGRCGDTMQIFLKMKDGCVERASFQTDGCGSSVVCGSFAAQLAIGRSPDELLDLSAEEILDSIGGLPEEEEHCAHLAAETVQKALEDYMLQQQSVCTEKKNPRVVRK
jgi:nitrogen fixation NifU-like protein